MTQLPADMIETNKRMKALGFRGRCLAYEPLPQSAVKEGVFRFNGIVMSDVMREWYGSAGTITGTDIAAWLAKQSGDIRVDINSPGGSFFDGVEIANMFRGYENGDITMRVVGMAASIASLVAMAGKRIEMRPGTMMMIHRSWTMAVGNSADLAAESEMLAKLDDEAAGIYAERCGVDRAEILKMMDAETWMSPAEAKSIGFADDDAADDDDAGDMNDDDDDAEMKKAAEIAAVAQARAELMISQHQRRLKLAAALSG